MNLKSQLNPANMLEKTATERGRIPMSLPQLKLAVPDLPGYHLHWMSGTPARISQALRAGYEFVDPSEVDVVSSGLADDAGSSGNTDMGSRVSVGSGMDERGGESRLYLMKLKQEFWDADQAVLESRNEQTAAALRGGQADGGAEGDTSNRYIPEAHRKGVATLFTPKNRR